MFPADVVDVCVPCPLESRAVVNGSGGTPGVLR